MIKYLTATYKDGARGEKNPKGGLFYDCWGMTRAARHELYGLPLLPSFAGEHLHEKKGMTRKYMRQARQMQKVKEPKAGTVIAVLDRKVICTHVALAIHDHDNSGGLHVLEINASINARLIPLSRFMAENQYKTVEFYDD